MDSENVLERQRSRRVALGLLLGCTFALAVVLVQPRALLESTVALTDSRLFVVVLLALYVVRPFLAVPMSLLTLVVGWRYGVLAGLPIAVVGTAVTTYPPYYVGRYYRSESGLLGWLSRKGEQAFDATGDLRGMIASRLAPAPAEGVSYGAGVAGVPPATYVVGTVVGELPWTLGYLVLGRSMQELTLGEVEVDVRFLAVAALAALLVVAPPIVRRFRGRDRE